MAVTRLHPGRRLLADGAVLTEQRHGFQVVLELGPVGTRVVHGRAADRAGQPDAPVQPGPAALRRVAPGPRQRRLRADAQPDAVAQILDRDQPLGPLTGRPGEHDQPADPLVRDEQVAATAEHRHRQPLSASPSDGREDLIVVGGPDQGVGRAADTPCGVEAHRRVALDLQPVAPRHHLGGRSATATGRSSRSGDRPLQGRRLGRPASARYGVDRPPESLQDQRPEGRHGAGADRQEHVSRAEPSSEAVRRLVDRPARDGARDAVHEILGTDAERVGLPGGVDVEDHGEVGRGERRREVGQQRMRPGVGVRLEGDDDPAVTEPGAGGGDRRRDLLRVMGVVVDYRHPAGVTLVVETAPYPGVRAERGGGGGRVVAERDEDGQRGQRVAGVVRAGHLQGQRVPLTVRRLGQPASVAGHEPPVAPIRLAEGEDGDHRPVGGGGHPSGAIVVTRDDQGPAGPDLTDEVDEGPVVGGLVGKQVGVVVVEVGDDRQVRVELEEGVVVLVGLDDHLLAPTGGGVRAGCPDHRPDRVGRVGPECDKGRDEHPAGRRLAVRAGDGHPPAGVAEHPEQPRPLDDRDAPPLGRLDLGVGATNRGRDDDEIGRGRQRHIGVADRDGDPLGDQCRGDVRRRRVRAADPVPPAMEQARQPTHADPADADEVDRAAGRREPDRGGGQG
ncbi:MAG: hypothetical protein AVDCRST_MAG33-3137 [uncultured Thermomicrobiales bacterium]|uniref:Uncharacterized protein n=1 Tax=uncultured Thermomicrobiales bacterium TaxID=1645740 RepID=A0A6J4VGM3_9BACT|nr:MAG: hypothetical protein AVDCRST_MAG33-3137 [uncultured Thermomicrobiales bacterium]